MRQLNKYPEYHYLERPEKIVETVIKQLREGKTIENKYLYLESIGAKNWSAVEKVLQLCENEESLLQEYFPRIDRLIKDHTQNRLYDIVSLGCGTGTDDISILEHSAMTGHFSMITIDLSWCILEQGTTKIFNYLRPKMNPQSDVNVLGICCDFNSLTKAKEVVRARRKNKVMLFHLLGLTIGNSHEINILKNISSIMESNDFLLLSVDLSASDKEALKSAINAYGNPNALPAVNNFLLGPLNFSTYFDTDKQNPSNDPSLKTTIVLNDNQIDYSFKDYWPKIIKTTSEDIECKQTGFSDIEKTVSLVRLYQFGNEKKNQLLCDYSNKYDRGAFEKFIRSLADNNEINLSLPSGVGMFEFGVSDKNLDLHKPNQYLILLQKKKLRKRKPNPKIEIEPRSKIPPRPSAGVSI
jgi:uncharacterized SAM-dependent methyltransferase